MSVSSCKQQITQYIMRGFPRVLRFSPLLKNQHFQIPILAWKVSPISAKALEDIDTKIK